MKKKYTNCYADETNLLKEHRRAASTTGMVLELMAVF